LIGVVVVTILEVVKIVPVVAETEPGLSPSMIAGYAGRSFNTALIVAGNLTFGIYTDGCKVAVTGSAGGNVWLKCNVRISRAYTGQQTTT
jgi:hypothetical protein